jgi:outer membrane protein assembly factor BamA
VVHKKIFFSALLLCCTFLSATANVFTISKIVIEGNRKTKSFVILRELVFKQNDTLTYQALQEKILLSHDNLYNTFLFNAINFSVFDSSKNSLSIKIKLVERFYSIPLPVLEIADRNFNVWWVEQKHDIRRLNAGVNFLQRNIGGRNETMNIVAQIGYTRQLGINYFIPYIDKKLRTGLQFYASFAQNKESAFITTNNKQLFLRDYSQFIKQRFQIGATFKYRRKIYNRHSIDINYSENSIEDTLVKNNPDYFLNGATLQHYTQVKYQYELDHRNIKYYPTKGYMLTIQAAQTGLLPTDNAAMSELTLLLSKYTPVDKKVFLYNSIKTKTSFPAIQPYNIQKAFGYGYEFVRGYEYSVMDGQHYTLLRNDIKYLLLHKKLKFLFTDIAEGPFDMYLKLFADMGYVKDEYYFKNNPLNNTWLYGYGAGIDVSTMYDIVVRLEYSITKTGTVGFFLHFKSNF